MSQAPDRMTRSTALAVVGSALLWAWGYLCYLSPVMFPYELVQSSVGIEYGFFVSQITSAAFALLVSLVGSRRQVVVRPGWFLLAAVGVSLSVLLIEATLYGHLPHGALFIAALMDGIGIPLLGIAWGTRYLLGTSGRMKTTSVILLSFLVAYGVYFAVSRFPQPWGAVATGLIPLLSWLAWHTDARARHALASEVLPAETPQDGRRFPGEVSLGDRRYSILPWRAISLIAFAAFTANLVTSFVLGRSYEATGVIAGGIIVVTGIVAIIFVIHFWARTALPMDRMYRLILPLVMVGLLAMLMYGSRGVIIGGSLITGCGMFMQCLVIIKVTESTREHGISPLVSFGVGQGVVAAVVFAGNVSGKAVFAALGSSEYVLQLLCALGVLVLFCMVLFVGRTSATGESAHEVTGCEPGGISGRDRIPSTSIEETGEAKGHSEESADEAAIQRLAERHGLTPRETEVLLRLGRGRSLPYIADQLFVTTGTVKTHTIHIYRKLGINSKQELIDMVEAERSEA